MLGGLPTQFYLRRKNANDTRVHRADQARGHERRPFASYAEQREQAEAWLAENGYERFGAE